jgi:hypothetical protein
MDPAADFSSNLPQRGESGSGIRTEFAQHFAFPLFRPRHSPHSPLPASYKRINFPTKAKSPDV